MGTIGVTLPNTESFTIGLQAFMAPVPPATVGTQVTSKRPGDVINWWASSGATGAVTLTPDSTGFNCAIQGVPGQQGVVNISVQYVNADNNQVTLTNAVQVTVTNASDVVSLSVTTTTPA